MLVTATHAARALYPPDSNAHRELATCLATASTIARLGPTRRMEQLVHARYLAKVIRRVSESSSPEADRHLEVARRATTQILFSLAETARPLT
jgi:hypothetical protein